MKIRESFALYYNNGQIWAGDYDALGTNYDILRNKIEEDMEVLKRPSSPAFVAVHLYDTDVPHDIAILIIDKLCKIQTFIKKVAFIGLDRQSKNNIKNCIKKSDIGFVFDYFKDYEKAKEWLVSK